MHIHTTQQDRERQRDRKSERDRERTEREGGVGEGGEERKEMKDINKERG